MSMYRLRKRLEAEAKLKPPPPPPPPPPPSPSPPPQVDNLSLELGSGRNPSKTCQLHHDRAKYFDYIDLAFDLDIIPWPLESNSLEYIYSHCVFEHLKVDIADWLDECWRILKPGGILEYEVPRFDSWMAWCDPTNHRAFSELTMEYWDPSMRHYVSYGSVYFADRNKWWDLLKHEVDKNKLVHFIMRVRK